MGNIEDEMSKKILQVLNKLIKMTETLTDAKAKEFRKITEIASKYHEYEKILEYQTKYGKERARHDEVMVTKQREFIKHQDQLKRFQLEEKARIQKEHDMAVERHIRLRHSLDQMNQSVGMFKSLLTGMSPMQAVGGGFSHAVNLIQTQRGLTDLKSRRENVLSEIAKAEEDKQGMFGDDKKKQARFINDLQQDLSGIRKLIKQEEESGYGKELAKGGAASKFAKTFEGLGDFVAKHKTGILISTASMGIFIGMLKTLLSVSPMMQKMLEVMNLAFTLVLRPFGDFIGFFLRPIAMMMLATVMPFFKEAYPMLAQLGTMLGEGFAEFMKTGDLSELFAALGFTFEKITPEKVLGFIFGWDRDGNTEGAVGAGALGIGAGAIGGTVGAAWLGGKALGGIKGMLGGGSPSTETNALEDTEDKDKSKNKKKMKANWKNIKGKIPAAKLAQAGKWAARFGTKAIPIAGWAMLAAELGLTAVKALNPDAYAALREGSMATFGDDVGGFLVPEKTLGEEIWDAGSAITGQGTTTETTAGGDTIIVTTNIGEVHSDVDVNEVTNGVAEGMQKSGKSRYR